MLSVGERRGCAETLVCGAGALADDFSSADGEWV